MNEDLYEKVEVGECGNCGGVEGPFERRQGVRCPHCDGPLISAFEVDQLKPDALESDTTASDFLDGEVR